MNRLEIRVDARALTKRFDGFVAVDGVSFQVQRGEIFGYLGPNGSGKTTTIRMLLGLLRPSGGSAEVLGYDIETQPEEIRPRVGYMSQKFALYDELTARENLRFYAGVYGETRKDRLEAVMDQLGLREVTEERAGKLPIGWRQRLALAVATVHDPTLLFLDEPTSGVDPLARRSFWNLIYDLAERGITILVTTHYMDEAEYCSRVGILSRGKLLALGAPSQLREEVLRGGVWDVYGENLLGALEALGNIPEVIQVGMAGNHLRVITQTGLSRRQFSRQLKGLGLPGVHVETADPSLEDVFLQLSGLAVNVSAEEAA